MSTLYISHDMYPKRYTVYMSHDTCLQYILCTITSLASRRKSCHGRVTITILLWRHVVTVVTVVSQ